MRLAPLQVQRFYSIWKPLLLYVNERHKLVRGMRFDDPRRAPDIYKLRQALWDDEAVLDNVCLGESGRIIKRRSVFDQELAASGSWKVFYFSPA